MTSGTIKEQAAVIARGLNRGRQNGELVSEREVELALKEARGEQ